MREVHSRKGLGAWREYVLTRVRSLEAATFEAALRHGLSVETTRDDWVITEVEGATASVAPVVAKIGEHLREARSCALESGGVTDWLGGQRVEGAWFGVHHAEALLVGILPPEEAVARIPDIAAAVEYSLPKDDQRRLRFEACYLNGPCAMEPLTPADQLFLADTLRAAYFLNAVEYSRVRNFRNVLIVATIVMTIVVTGVLVVGSLRPGTVPVCVRRPAGAVASAPSGLVCPSGDAPNRAQTGGDVLLVGLFGLIGAGLAAARALTTTEEIPTRYSPALPQTLLKLPSGAATGIVGVVAIQAGLVPGVTTLDAQGAILIWAVVFGFAQQVLTGLIDDKGQQLLTKASPTSQAGPSSPPPTGPHRHGGRRHSH